MEQVKVGLLGLGTVGTGVWKMLKQNQDVIARQTGKFFEIVSILVRDVKKERNLEGVQSLLTDRFEDVLEHDVDVIVEAMGGVEPAKTYIETALKRGLHVVTANKELMAKHGQELEKLAYEKGVHLFFEASVGGGIPVLGTVLHLLKANRIQKVYGILNGTTNFILTEMAEHGRTFTEVLQEAQAKGYAEADPTADVEGYDAAHKLVILSRLAFRAHVPVEEVETKGITDLSPGEMHFARLLGYRIKLLAQAEQFGEHGPIACSVEPTLVPIAHPLAHVDGVYNAIYLQGDFVQDITLVGQGAGEQPTGSAMVEDLSNIFRLAPARFQPTYQPMIFSANAENRHRFLFVTWHEAVTQTQVNAWKTFLDKHGAEVSAFQYKDNQFACVVSHYHEGLAEQLAEIWPSHQATWLTRPILNSAASQKQEKAKELVEAV